MMNLHFFYTTLQSMQIASLFHYSTHLPPNEMAAISQTILSDAFLLMKFVPKGSIDNNPTMV